MKAIVLLAMLATNIMLALPARAGVADGFPSPFMRPYPDYGCNARCIIRAELAHDALVRAEARRHFAARNAVRTRPHSVLSRESGF